jgi:hypothetical protein
MNEHSKPWPLPIKSGPGLMRRTILCTWFLANLTVGCAVAASPNPLPLAVELNSSERFLDEVGFLKSLLTASEAPQELQDMLEAIAQDPVPYPTLAADLIKIATYLDKKNWRRARRLAEDVIQAKANLKNGPSAELKTLTNKIYENRIKYTDRSPHFRRFEDNLRGGDFTAAKRRASKVIITESFGKKGGGVPPDSLRKKLQLVDNERIEFPRRSQRLLRVNKLVYEGSFELAEEELDQLKLSQDNLRKTGGKPTDALLELLAEVEKGMVRYPERPESLWYFTLTMWNGQFEKAAVMGQQIVDRQNNLRGGVPPNLQKKLTSILERVNTPTHPASSQDLLRVYSHLSNGNFIEAEAWMDDILDGR